MQVNRASSCVLGNYMPSLFAWLFVICPVVYTDCVCVCLSSFVVFVVAAAAAAAAATAASAVSWWLLPLPHLYVLHADRTDTDRTYMCSSVML